MLHLNYRWHWEHCGMTEVRVTGEMEMTHNAARISAATYPEIEAAHFISGCCYSFFVFIAQWFAYSSPVALQIASRAFEQLAWKMSAVNTVSLLDNGSPNPVLSVFFFFFKWVAETKTWWNGTVVLSISAHTQREDGRRGAEARDRKDFHVSQSLEH